MGLDAVATDAYAARCEAAMRYEQWQVIDLRKRIRQLERELTHYKRRAHPMISTWWASLSGANKGTIEAGVVTVLGPVVDVVVQELQTGTLDSQQVLKALGVGAAAGIVYGWAYLRALTMMPSGMPIPTPMPPAVPAAK